MNNVISISEDEMSGLQRLSNEDLKKELLTAMNAKAEATEYEDLVRAEIINRHSEEIQAALAVKDEPFGTVNIGDLAFVRSKRVEWDQDGLKAIHDDIVANGQDPAEYMTVKYGVREAAFKNWPSAIQNEFIAARTVKPGAMTVKVKGE